MGFVNCFAAEKKPSPLGEGGPLAVDEGLLPLISRLRRQLLPREKPLVQCELANLLRLQELLTATNGQILRLRRCTASRAYLAAKRQGASVCRHLLSPTKLRLAGGPNCASLRMTDFRICHPERSVSGVEGSVPDGL